MTDSHIQNMEYIDAARLCAKAVARYERDARFCVFPGDFVDTGTDKNSEWEWDLHRLFRDAMGNRASWGYKDLMKEVMRLSHIKWNQHYYKLLAKAEEQRIVKKTLDRCGRVVIMNVPGGGSAA